MLLLVVHLLGCATAVAGTVCESKYNTTCSAADTCATAGFSGTGRLIGSACDVCVLDIPLSSCYHHGVACGHAVSAFMGSSLDVDVTIRVPRLARLALTTR